MDMDMDMDMDMESKEWNVLCQRRKHKKHYTPSAFREHASRHASARNCISDFTVTTTTTTTHDRMSERFEQPSVRPASLRKLFSASAAAAAVGRLEGEEEKERNAKAG